MAIVNVDIPESELRAFDAEVKRYMALTGKDGEYVANRTALNVAIKAGMGTPPANAAEIRALPQKEWWPKFVAKRIRQGSKVRLQGKTPKRYKGRRHITGKYTREEARMASRQIVKNRLRKRGYIRSGWLPAIQTLSAMKLKARGRVGQTPSFAKDREKQPGGVTPARPGIAPVCEIVNFAAGADVVAGRALARAIPEATVDMRQFLNEKYGETAKDFQ